MGTRRLTHTGFRGAPGILVLLFLAAVAGVAGCRDYCLFGQCEEGEGGGLTAVIQWSPAAPSTCLDVTLDGSASSNAASYEWSLTARPEGSLTDIASKTASTTRFTPDKEGDYTVKLVVSDGSASDEEEQTITVALAPVAVIGGGNRSVLLGEEVTVDGSGSMNPDDNCATPPSGLTFYWSLRDPNGLPAAFSDLSDPMRPRFIASLPTSLIGSGYSVSLYVVITARGVRSLQPDPIVYIKTLQ